jgi:hypothetical protein
VGLICLKISNKKNKKIMRFSLEYDVELSNKTKGFIYDNFNESMVSPNNDSIQYCLVDIIDGLINNIDTDDYDTLKEYHSEGVDYIEIV